MYVCICARKGADRSIYILSIRIGTYQVKSKEFFNFQTKNFSEGKKIQKLKNAEKKIQKCENAKMRKSEISLYCILCPNILMWSNVKC